MKRVLLVLTASFLLAGCTTQEVVTESVATESEVKLNDLYTLSVGDKELHVPFSVKELEAAGLKLSESTVDEVRRGADNIAYYVDDNDGMIVVNLGSYVETCEYDEAYVIDILSDKGNTDTSILGYRGLTFESTKEEVEAVFGEPTFEDNGMTMYSMTEEGAYMDGAYVAMDGDNVIRIEVLSTKDFVDWEEEESE